MARWSYKRTGEGSRVARWSYKRTVKGVEWLGGAIRGQ